METKEIPADALPLAEQCAETTLMLGLPVVPVDRVRASTAAPVEPTGQGAAVLRPLRCQALPADRRAAPGHQGAGDGGHLFSKGPIDG